jgi:hypothetical protein
MYERQEHNEQAINNKTNLIFSDSGGDNQLVETLCYNPEGSGFDFREGVLRCFITLTLPVALRA